MKVSQIQKLLKPWMLPIAMLCGVLFHDSIGEIAFLSPYIIFIMLLITYCRVSVNEFKVTKFIWALLAVPTATAAPVITGMLGGSIPRLATYSLFSNIAVAILAPLLFTYMGTDADLTFAESFFAISTRVFPLILAPLALALLFQAFMPRVHDAIASRQSLSFYIWAVALIIVVGNAVSFIMKEPAEKIPEMLLLALASLVVCCAQFWIGRRVGARLGDKISGAQGLGQKNTVLAIWMALTYLNPIASVGPAAYVAWQNTINSMQLYFKTRRETIS